MMTASQMIRTLPESEQRETVLREARTWLRTPHRNMARVKGQGVDCGQYLIAVYHAVGLIPDVQTGWYPPDWHLHRSEQKYLSWVKVYARPVAHPKPADLVLYQFGRCISHGAIIVDWPTILHAEVRIGVVLGDGHQGSLAGRCLGFWRLNEWAD